MLLSRRALAGYLFVTPAERAEARRAAHRGDLWRYAFVTPRLRGYFCATPGEAEEKRLVDVDPLMNRCVLFWSDHRVPHEVLPASQDR
eukprot:1194977-Prorocentrum_minimum.AAC.6